jgi:hypothetical protein
MRLNFGPLTQRGTLIGLCILVAALLSIIFHLNRRYYDCLSRYNYECPMRLTGLWLQTSARHQFSSVFPPDVSYFARDFQDNAAKRRLHLHPLLCPGSETTAGSISNAVEWSDYTYVNWSKWFSGSNTPPGSFPLVYDRRLSNHGGRAVYIMKIDGSVAWDPNANWLKEFAKSPPEYAIQVPQ